ncbi:MAG TPA: MATE family efflux transporter [Candidatus Merdivicinus intestinavium]|nr:MATE family efflux transporter [Candidatus Merdivicinus intestinavium]
MASLTDGRLADRLFDVKRFLRGSAPLGDIPPGRAMFRNALLVAWPSILESFLVALVGVIDTVMVSSLGSYAIAAVGLTTQPKFICLAVFISLNVAVSALVARRRGEDDRESANSILVQALVVTIGLTVVISAAAVIFADPIIRLAGSAEDTHEAAVSYFRIISGGMVFNVLSMVINAAQRGAGNTKIAMRTNIVSNGVNIIFNYLLIGGHFGFPRLEVAGAAVATVIGTVFACGMSIFSVLKKDRFLSLLSVKKIGFDRRSLRSLADLGASTLAEQIFLRIGFLTYAIIVARLGTTAFAAHQVGMNIMSISFSFGDGLSVAAVALVGRSLGEKRQDLAKIYGAICQRMGLTFSIILCIIYVTCGEMIFTLFSDETVILKYGSMIMDMIAVIVFMQITQVIYSGCLRGGGDTKFVALVSLVSVAFFRPFSGWLFCYPLGMGLTGAWIGLAIDQFCRLAMTFFRFKSGKWTMHKI